MKPKKKSVKDKTALKQQPGHVEVDKFIPFYKNYDRIYQGNLLRKNIMQNKGPVTIIHVVVFTFSLFSLTACVSTPHSSNVYTNQRILAKARLQYLRYNSQPHISNDVSYYANFYFINKKNSLSTQQQLKIHAILAKLPPKAYNALIFFGPYNKPATITNIVIGKQHAYLIRKIVQKKITKIIVDYAPNLPTGVVVVQFTPL